MFDATSRVAARLFRRVERLMMGRRAYKWVVRDWFPLVDLPAARDALGTMRFTRQIEPQLLDGPAADDILVIAPHPDDEVIGPGGALIRAARAGRKVTVLFVTSGATEDAAVREREARACAELCSFEVRFLGATERGIQVEDAARGIAALLAETKPGAVFVPFFLDDHDDHRRVNEAMLRAVADTALARAPEVWAYQVYTPIPGNVVVDITDVADDKAMAIRTYESQMRRRDWAHFALGLNAFNCRLLPGRQRSYAESFFVLPMTDYIALCSRYFASGKAYYDAAYARK